MPASAKTAIYRLLNLKPAEFTAAFLSFVFIFTLMASYYVLRPVRDAMASDWSDAELSWLWTLNFFISLGAVSIYGWIASRLRPEQLVPAVYGFFAASFGLFYLATQWLENTRLLDQCFYVWVSFFALFHVSVFWSFMSGLFDSAQSKRLFGLFSAGASIGALLGPLLPILLVERIGVYPLLLLAALLLAIVVPIALRLLHHQPSGQAPVAERFQNPLGGRFTDGFVDLLSHRFLLGIALFLLLYTLMSTFLYFELKNAMSDIDRSTRTQYWGMMDFAVNSLSILTALFLTSRIATRFGLTATLALIPILLLFGWVALAIVPALGVLVAMQVLRRAGNYAITRPGREMLFTAVDPSTRFKTKPVIDIVIYRGGDVLAGWTYTGLAQGIGLGLGAMALVAALLAALWTLVAVYLGNRFETNTAIGTTAPGTTDRMAQAEN